ncbi:MAG: nuclear transport factor 2 family protein [Azonexus sp.]|nr:nuclear transport factor 2 family protein [Betaproteobacteria bacterium]MBK8916537.1 nuclear transport factor 2 family protein [Betaproteobacteria bacterium]MBP6035729.1 nuclear transport factor 2 family protein [Azonexus sp.]MBP6906891.1 nuclear transport factor 2 family protein [Azonexus sp.]
MRSFIFALLLSLGLNPMTYAAEDDRAADRQALLLILKDVESGINDANVDLMARHIDDKAVVTWLNAEVSNGPDEVRAYFRRMVGDAPGTILSKYSTHPKIAGPATFYGDFAVAHGTTADEFTPHHRSVFRFETRWTASLRKVDGQWKIIALNLSTNTFNNVLITELERLALYAGVGGLAAGLGLAAGWAFLRRRKAAPAG